MFIKKKRYFKSKLPNDFISKNYIELNEDLQNLTELQAKIHYENYGYNENRKYKYENIPNDFISKNYIELNEDLQNLTELQAKIHYENYGYNENRQYKQTHFPFSSQINNNISVKPICIYFPQFHEIEENNHWEKGWNDFTWLKNLESNDLLEIIKPHRDIGYYNILDYNVRKNQGILANTHGIYGFCYYHYWFYGYKQKCIMHKFFDKLLEDNEPNIPFFINWANEPWTKKWNNGVNDMICDQKYDTIDENIIPHFNYLLPLFKHKNYIKVNNKPVFVIYQIYHIHNHVKLFIDKFNQLAKSNGFDGIFFIQSIGLNHKSSGINTINNMVDGAYETIPNNSFMSLFEKGKYENTIKLNNQYLLNKKISINYMNEYDKNSFIKYNKDIIGKSDSEIYNIYLHFKKNNDISRFSKFNVFDDNSIYYEALNYTKYIKNQYYGITPGFNNLPRTQNKCKTTLIISNDNNRVELFENTLNQMVLKTIISDMDEKFIFINAWNEWGEGMCMEPSDLYGYSFLNSLKRVMVKNKQIICNAKIYKCAVLTTYKNRPDDLNKYYKNIKKSFELVNDTHFEYFLLNQDNDLTFNKTKLWNAGIKELIDKYDFYIFNDLDHFANDENNFNELYSYPYKPTHLSTYVEQFNYMPNSCVCKKPKNCICPHIYDSHMCGGVFKINNTHLKLCKGFNNDFIGWGCEDCDIAYRLRTFTQLQHAQGIYNSDLGDNYHRYFSCKRFISNKIIMYFSIQNPVYYIENNGYHTLEYTINSRTKNNDINILNIDFLCEDKYYLIINNKNFNNNFVEYISKKFNNYVNKPISIIINPSKENLDNLEKTYGMVMINSDIKIIGDISYIVNNANNKFICNYRALINTYFDYDYETNGFNHIYFNQSNSNNIFCKEKDKKSIYDVFKKIKTNNSILNFKSNIAKCGLITSNLGYFLLTCEKEKKYFDFDFRYLAEGVDLNINDLNYDKTIYLPPIIVNESMTNDFDIKGFVKNNYSDLKNIENLDMEQFKSRFNGIDFTDNFINMTYRLNGIW
jgi:hypothetical protein